ncbi:MAG: hypothetical protein JWP94_2699 [Mucilaginibacter sp.]|nr:hypothetical protein [Mucilaginibacter sp.]
MEDPEKNTEPFVQTAIRAILTTTIIAVILSWLHIFPSGDKSKLTLFEMIWLIVFCIVFGGHWLELVFINQVKFALPKNIVLLYFIRIGYWFLCSIPLFFIANLINDLFSHKTEQLGHWWAFGFFYNGIQLLMHAIMHIRFKKSFYNGVY